MNNVEKRVERMAERWRRALACHPKEIAIAEIDFDLEIVRKAISERTNYYNLTPKEAKELYPKLLQMKTKTLHDKRGKNKKLISFRLSEDARMKLEYLAEKGGVSMTAVIENMILRTDRFEIWRAE